MVEPWIALRRARCGGLVALLLASCVVRGQAPAVEGEAPPAAPEAGLLEPFSLAGGGVRIVLPRGGLTVRPSGDGQVHVRGRLAAGPRLRRAERPAGPVLRVLDEGRLFPAAASREVEVPADASLSNEVDDTELDSMLPVVLVSLWRGVISRLALCLACCCCCCSSTVFWLLAAAAAAVLSVEFLRLVAALLVLVLTSKHSWHMR